MSLLGYTPSELLILGGWLVGFSATALALFGFVFLSVWILRQQRWIAAIVSGALLSQLGNDRWLHSRLGIAALALGLILAIWTVYWLMTKLFSRSRHDPSNDSLSKYYDSTKDTYSREEHLQSQWLDALEEVLELEVIRRAKGFKVGWIYHQCKGSELLLKALGALREQGTIPRSDTASEQTESHYNGKEQRTPFDQKAFDPYEILGVQRNATQEEIQRGYREQMKLYHPDRVDHLGGDLKKLANERSKDIQRAYSELRAA